MSEIQLLYCHTCSEHAIDKLPDFTATHCEHTTLYKRVTWPTRGGYIEQQTRKIALIGLVKEVNRAFALNLPQTYFNGYL